MPSPANPLNDCLEELWQHIERTEFSETPNRKQALSIIAGQMKVLADRGRYLTAVLTRQIETLSDKRIEEAVKQIDDDRRDSIGWSSW